MNYMTELILSPEYTRSFEELKFKLKNPEFQKELQKKISEATLSRLITK